LCSALGFAGTVLLRSDEDLAYARQRRPLVLLADVAHPWDSEPDDNVT
jgi:ATP adenylyltransferase/5',5'''-P-1,P-4-tetraphosphate phosphorylase II